MSNNFMEKFQCYPHEYFFDNGILKHINSSIALDLFNIFCLIYYADIMTKGRDNNWINYSREIRLVVPVINYQIYERNKILIEKLANFMSEDKWNILFKNIQGNINICKSKQNISSYDNVSLFSGGLDSLCGAYYNKKKGLKTFYCGYILNTYEQHFQQKTLDFVKSTQECKAKLFKKINCRKKVPTQRTRSLLFFALACLNAIAYNVKTISLYENGILSLNPEGYSRKTTKTTHPKTIYMFNTLLKNLDLQIQIEHPFLFKTKGEIINNLPIEFKRIIKDTYTCGMSRQNRNYNTGKHCGVCIPCMLRKISIAAYDLENYDREYEIPYDIKITQANPKHQEEYKSSNEYFKLLKNKIDNNQIFNEINILGKYYNNNNYLELTQNMLMKFSKEIEKFYNKYDIL